MMILIARARAQKASFQAPVVQNMDSAIQRINLYPVDSAIGFPNTYPLDSDLSDLDSVIQLLNNWGQVSCGRGREGAES